MAASRARSRQVRAWGFERLEARCVMTGGLVLGTNLPLVRDYEAVVFTDVTQQMRAWQTRASDPLFRYDSGLYDTGLASEIPVDADGWPLMSPFVSGAGSAQVVHTVVPVRGAGSYRLFGDGAGQLTFIAGEGLLDPSSGFLRGRTIQFPIPAEGLPFEIYDSDFGDGTGELFLYFDSSLSGNPIRNLRLLPPESVQPAGPSSFRDSFTDKLATFENIRFMDWMSTNNNPLREWSDRVTLSTYTQALEVGVAVEYITELANQLQQDAWVTIPAEASDDFVFRFASHLRQHLQPGLKVFVEYSNETWNGIFGQSAYVQAEGKRIWPTVSDFVAGTRFHAKRSAEIWKTFETVFAADADERLIKVLATQSANIGVTEQRLQALADPAINPLQVRPDALAIGAYFGDAVADALGGLAPPGDAIDPSFVDAIMSALEQDLVSNTASHISAQKQLAEQHDLWLITYEGGQHLVANVPANRQNQSLTNHLIEANRDERMFELYFDYLQMLEAADVALHNHYTYIYTPNQFGSWGLLENQDQAVTESPKFRALLDFAAASPAGNRLPKARAGDDALVIDDGNGVEAILLDAIASRDFDGRIVQYQWMIGGNVVADTATYQVNLPIGIHSITLAITDNEGGVVTDEVQVIVSPVQAGQTMVQADFSVPPTSEGVWPGYTQLAPQVAYSGWTLGGSLQPSVAPGVLGYTADYRGDRETTLQDAVQDNQYLSFTIDSQAEQTGAWLDVRLAPVDFTIRRVSFWAPRVYTVMVSSDGFATSQTIFQTPRIDSWGEAASFSFVMPDLGFYTDRPLEFRIYGWEARYNQKTAQLEAFRLGGSTRPGPGPSDIVLSQTAINENVNRPTLPVWVSSLSSPNETPGAVHSFALVAGEGDDHNQKFFVMSNSLILRAGESLDYEASPVLRVRLRSTDAHGLTHERAVEIGVRDLAEVQRVSVNNGQAQRSRVTSLQVQFDGVVDIASEAFLVRHRTTGAIVNVVASPPVVAGGSTTVQLTFAGTQVEAGSLRDGVYELIISANRVLSTSGLGLDGNRDGVPGDNYTFGSLATDRFYRLFGDLAGDRVVDAADFFWFRRSFETSSTSAQYNAAFDFNADGLIGVVDFFEFRRRFGRSQPHV